MKEVFIFDAEYNFCKTLFNLVYLELEMENLNPLQHSLVY